MKRRPPGSPRFPDTTLFRSLDDTAPPIPRQKRRKDHREGDARDGQQQLDRKSGSAGMPRPNSYAGFCLNKAATAIVGACWGTWMRERIPKKDPNNAKRMFFE